jgi:hypothetical protein
MKSLLGVKLGNNLLGLLKYQAITQENQGTSPVTSAVLCKRSYYKTKRCQAINRH